MEATYFEQLKKHIQAQYLQNHTPSFDEISKWKGIDIVYFQEDLRKIAKGNISEKSFYTYFKGTDSSKLPRIDMLNLLSIYVGYQSWSDYKKNNPIIEQEKETSEVLLLNENSEDIEEIKIELQDELEGEQKTEVSISTDILDLENQYTEEPIEIKDLNTDVRLSRKKSDRIKEYIWMSLVFLFGVSALILGFKDEIFGRTFTYCFSDADRSLGVRSTIEIKVFKQNESPLVYKIKPGECFYYHTKDKNLIMEIFSPFYEHLKVTRNLESAPKVETIELKPDDYKFAFYYFSLKDVTGNSQDIIAQKRKELENRISNDAIIKQIYDSDIYGVETISKEKYITLVTTPTTSLKNLNLLEMKRNDKGKIISIKFKINNNENK